MSLSERYPELVESIDAAHTRDELKQVRKAIEGELLFLEDMATSRNERRREQLASRALLNHLKFRWSCLLGQA